MCDSVMSIKQPARKKKQFWIISEDLIGFSKLSMIIAFFENQLALPIELQTKVGRMTKWIAMQFSFEFNFDAFV